MKRIIVLSVALVLCAVAWASAAWMTNINHHMQIRIQDGWNVESETMKAGDRLAVLMLAAPELEKKTTITAILSMELAKEIKLEDFKKIFEDILFKNKVKVVSEEKRGFNNLKGIFVTYDVEFDNQPFRIMCFFTQKDKFVYGIFSGTLATQFEEKRAKLEEVFPTIQYVANP